MRFTYLLIDLASLVVPLAFSFHPRLRFDKNWKAFLPVLLAVALFFCCWDAVFVQWNVWGFNSSYVTGISVFNLPIEEILFFLCIPYSCVFAYHCFGIFLSEGFQSKKLTWISWLLAAGLLAGAIFFRGRLYPAVTFILLAIALITFSRQPYMRTFFFTYLIMLIPFFVVNGILTGTGLENPVVWYNSDEIIGLRLGTIPVEDIFYGMLLILLNVVGMEWLLKKKA